MLYKNKVNGTYKFIDGNIDIVDELTYSRIDILDGDRMNKEYLMNVLPENEFTDKELDNISKFIRVCISYSHLKTGHIYSFLGLAIECTNGQEEEIKVLYYRDGVQFVREIKEFFKKFKRYEKIKENIPNT